MKETVHIWKPLSGLASRYDIDDLHDSCDGFVLLLSEDRNSAKKVKIYFENSVEAYRVTYETFRQKTLLSLTDQDGTELLGQWTFFIVESSEYIKWLSEESFHITNSLELNHFLFVGCNQTVDVLSIEAPRIEFFV